MRFEKFEKRPRHVDKAVKSGDIEAARMFGQKGGEATAKKRDEEKTLEKWGDQIKAKEEAVLRKSTNEDVLTADGEEVDQ